MNYEIGNPEMAWLLVAIPIVAIVFIRARWLNRKARQQFGAAAGKASWIRDSVSALLLTCGVALLALACMDIRWGKTTREVPQRGLEVVFALDVSRSMLAQDAKPNRLTRAKQQIKDMLAEMAGDRVGLVVFAGEASQAVPLTNHYHDFQQKLDSVGPESVSVGGSQLGVAINAASEAFLSKTNDHKTMVLFTDGEDQESKPVELAKRLHAETGLRIFTVGLGDMSEGARIPDNGAATRRSRTEQFVQHNGQQVWSKLNGSVLKQIATESNAAYIPAGTKRVNMADVYHRYIASVEKAEFETAKINALIPRFQWFAFPAFVCVLLHIWMGTSSRKRASISASQVSKHRRQNAAPSRVAKTAAAALVMFPSVAFGQTDIANVDSIAEQINAANELVRQEKATEAIEAFNAIEEPDADHRDELRYNLASAHYRNSDIDAAATLFSETSMSTNDRIAADSRYNLGNCHYAKALPIVDQQPEAAIAELETARQHFRSALRLDRSLSNARENLERASKLIEQIKQKQDEQQQKNEEQQSEDQSDSSEEQPEQSESKENESEKNEDSAENEDPSGENQEQSQEQQGEESQDSQDGNSEDSSEDSGDSNKGKDQKPSDESSQQPADDPNESQSKQQDSNQSQSQQGTQNEQETSSASEENKTGDEPPEGEVTALNESETDKEADDNDQQSALARLNNEDNGMMTRQEALKLLQSVRDRDMLRRFRQKQRQRSNRVKVEKDW